MNKVFKLRRGLDIRLQGAAELKRIKVDIGDEVALMPGSFSGLIPKVTVKEGDHVNAGQALFVNKQYPEVGFASPVSGIVAAIVRGERRKVLRVVLKPDAEQCHTDYGIKPVEGLSADEVIDTLLQAGLFGYIDQLPYAISTNPQTKPKAIFVSALRDKPLACDFEYELEGNEKDFQTGLDALSKVATTYLGVGSKQQSSGLLQARHVQVNVFDGPCPAGNVGVQVNHIAPVNKGDVVWTVDPTAVIFFGRLFNTGKVDLRRTVAIVGSEVSQPVYAEVLVGQRIDTMLKGKVDERRSLRIIDGNVLTGRHCGMDDYLGAHSSEVTVIPEGDQAHEMFGWIMPRLRQFSVNRSYFSWLMGGRKYALDARVKGGRRHMIMSGEYDKVLPMDIYGEFLIKAIITQDIDKMEQLGIYEVAPEDFALAEFVDSSKLELQRIVREGLDMLRKENA